MTKLITFKDISGLSETELLALWGTLSARLKSGDCPEWQKMIIMASLETILSAIQALRNRARHAEYAWG